MANIHVLSFELANLIAAGEVVDRPASVLKELLENAIDAGADRITAEIRGGGVAMIRVSDNGCGMSAEDLPVAIRRHATSKIRTADDLSSIGTLGFRGEALAAIAAVSELRIVTKTKDAESGVMLASSGGRVTEVSEVGATDGTTVVVEGLFANVPARRKFLKKDSTETMAATAVVEKLAISRPDISIAWITDGNERFRTAGDGELRSALYAVLGRDFAGRLLEVNGGVGGIRVRGFVGTSDNIRANRNHQNFFINNRYVKSKTAMAAIEKAYTSYIAPEKFPVCALFLDILPAAVDVNVHPAKLEVKFSDERAVFEAIYYAVRQALEENTARPALSLAGKGNGAATPARFDTPSRGEQISAPAYAAHTAPDYTGRPETTPAAPRLTVREALENLRSFREDSETGAAAPRPATPALALAADAQLAGEADLGAAEARWSAPVDITAPVCRENVENASAASSVEASAEKKPLPTYRIIGEAFACYFFVETEGELLVIDKHAAHERILYEEMKEKRRRDGRVSSQSLLVPLSLSLSATEVAAAEEARTELEAVGFAFGADTAAHTVTLTAIPATVALTDAEGLFAGMAADLTAGTGNPAETEENRLDRALYQVACKAAVKGGRLYGEAQMRWLVERLLSLPDITVCPHGRPVAMRLTKNELDRRFCRLV